MHVSLVTPPHHTRVHTCSILSRRLPRSSARTGCRKTACPAAFALCRPSTLPAPTPSTDSKFCFSFPMFLPAVEMSRYPAPSTRGQWQSNAYDILRPRCQNFMRERGNAPLPSPIRQPSPDSPQNTPSNTYSVHSPQVTGSPFKLIDRRLEGVEYIDPRAVLSPRRYGRASMARCTRASLTESVVGTCL